VYDISIGNNNKYAFLATGQNSAELQIIDISDPSTNISSVGSVDMGSDILGVAYHFKKDIVYTAGESSGAEFQVTESGPN